MTSRARPIGSRDEAPALVTSGRIAFVEMRYPPKLIVRPTADVVIGPGNHLVTGADGPEVDATTIECLHAPLRSREVLYGYPARLRLLAADTPPGDRWHVRRWAARAEQGDLRAEWAANSHVDGVLDVGERRPLLVPDRRLYDIAVAGCAAFAAYDRGADRPARTPLPHSSHNLSDPDLRPDDAHGVGVLAVPPGSRVLDVGCGPGLVARLLAGRDCVVTGLERDPVAARDAARWCARVIGEDVEAIDFDATFAGERFDAVLALDVLEHLTDPGATVRRLAGLLDPGGRLVVSIPNVTHAAVRLHLLAGRFETADSGLLDRTHLHFFDRRSAERLLTDAGLVVVDRLRTRRGLTETEIAVDLDAVPDGVLQQILADDDAETYQFILVAVPAASGSTNGSANGSADGADDSLASALQRQLEDAVEDVRAGAAYARQVEAEVASLTARLHDATAESEAQRERVAE
ncbi:MAG TPA: class I SAM-dependent methyltransferase, partial [Acidimicrobiales bacterium]|nr:class I SAM-dependent methyltransferase [Acidimicrobiales bacterium]